METLLNYLSIRFVSEIIGYTVIVSVLVLSFMRVMIMIWHILETNGFKWRANGHTWAVITGSTDGIGLEYAKQLAAKGYNLLLISRNQHKLIQVKEDIHLKYGCDILVRVLEIDFSDSCNNIYNKIESEFENLDEIHVLVNNVGITYPNERPEYLTNIPDLNEFIVKLINVNIISCTRLTAMVLPRMVRKSRGVIINLSSFSAIYPIPLLSLYSATKVYIDFMSRALQEEYRSKGIIIQSVLPFYVSTRMTYNKKPSFIVPSAERFVKHALATVGREDRTGGFLAHRLWGFLNFWMAVASRFIGIDVITKFTFWRLQGVRQRIVIKERQNNKKGTLLQSQDDIV